MTTPLIDRSCRPCRAGEPPLSPAEAEALLPQLVDWRILDAPQRIERRWRFADFEQALAFVQAVAGLAEREGHHPDVGFGWGYAVLSLHTHAIGGLHANDFILAAKVDRLDEGLPPPPAKAG